MTANPYQPVDLAVQSVGPIHNLLNGRLVDLGLLLEDG
jgi:hypothetical protein